MVRQITQVIKCNRNINQVFYQFNECKKQINIFLQFSEEFRDSMQSFSNASSAQQCQTLLPITQLFPPNELITKKYEPDAAVTLKLVTASKFYQERKQVTQQSEIKYGQDFQDTDTLGYEYAQLMKKNLLYLKFNNKGYNTMKLKGETYRFFGGLFIPIDHLTNQTVKQNKNVYKTLKNVNFIDYTHNIPNSFANNCSSKYPDVSFSSNYESSNLFAAIKKGTKEYDLILQNDINSKGNTQWFNFAVQFHQQNMTYRFNIVNFTKSTSLYQKGMKIVHYSFHTNQMHKIGWAKGCEDIIYQKTGIGRQDMIDQSYYTLKFSYIPKYKNDIVIFSYSFPYNLLDAEKFFSRMIYRRISCSMKIQRVKICETLSGFPVYGYSIIHKKNKKDSKVQKFNKYQANSLFQTANNFNCPKIQPRKSIVFMGRQHPGESVSSYVVQGIVDFLLQNNQYDNVKKNYNFYVIPMVNVDGVYYGNYRTNLSGNDLNRIWRNPKREYHCEVYNIKKFLIQINRESQICLIVDVHGHSRALNSFFYGNSSKKDAVNLSCQNPRFFPYFCSKKVKQISYYQSTFSVTQDKKNTARVVLSQMFPKALVYTFENSFFGWKKGSFIVEHNQDSYRKIGRDLVSCYLDYSKMVQKNPDLIEKWQKQIQQMGKWINDKGNSRGDDSDSEAQNQLINFPQTEPTLFENRGLTQLSFQKNRASKVKTVNSRSIKSIRTSRKCLIPMPQSPNIFYKQVSTSNQKKRASLNKPRKFASMAKQNGFLSIVKIDTNKPDEQQQKADFSKQMTIYNQRELLIEKLRRRKINLQEAMSSCSGVKGFLKAMGITIQKR